jgi:hypothetical protein
MRTGSKPGPRDMVITGKVNEPIDLDQNLEEAVKKSISAAYWLEEADQGAAIEAVLLAKTMDEFPQHRHKIAPVLIALLNNLGCLNNRKQADLSPADMLAAIANG